MNMSQPIETGDGFAFRRTARRYFYAAAVYLSLGSVLGLLLVWSGNDNFKFTHGHMMLVGVLLFAAYGAGNLWIAKQADSAPPPDSCASMAVAQFWLANIGLPGMLLGTVLPVGVGLDRVGFIFGLMEVAAAVLYGLMLRKALKAM